MESVYSSGTLASMTSIDQNCCISGSSGLVIVVVICRSIDDVDWEFGRLDRMTDQTTDSLV